jgi:hypothetical protein
MRIKDPSSTAPVPSPAPAAADPSRATTDLAQEASIVFPRRLDTMAGVNQLLRQPVGPRGPVVSSVCVELMCSSPPHLSGYSFSGADRGAQLPEDACRSAARLSSAAAGSRGQGSVHCKPLLFAFGPGHLCQPFMPG